MQPFSINIAQKEVSCKIWHGKLRDNKLFQSQLDVIEGIGEKRKMALLKHFGSVEAIGLANVEEIASVTGMTEKAAEEVKKALGKV